MFGGGGHTRELTDFLPPELIDAAQPEFLKDEWDRADEDHTVSAAIMS